MDTPFAYGAVYGTRSWYVDTDGYLTGVVYKQRWLPGENLATCRRIRKEYVDPTTGRSWVNYSQVPPGDPGLPIEPGHMVRCGAELTLHNATRAQGFGGCGFHAYLEGSNDYRSAADASGVVALYGRGVRGTRGGRFMKARIVALFIPRDLDAMRSDPDHHRRLYADMTAEQLQRLDDTVQAKYLAVRARYPGIPFYDSWVDMLRNHPTTPPMDFLKDAS